MWWQYVQNYTQGTTHADCEIVIVKRISETKPFLAFLEMYTLKVANVENKQQRDCKSQCWLPFHQPLAPRLPATSVCRPTFFLQLVSRRAAKWNPGSACYNGVKSC